jgi:hypothetical protein
VLAEHAPELLARIDRVKASAVNAAAVAAARHEEPLPGIERVTARGSLVVRPDRNAGQAVERLVQAGVIPWDGRLLCSGQATLRERSPRPHAPPTRTERRRMTHYQPAQRVQVFDPQLQRHIEGDVLTATTSCVRVSLDDRMVPVNVDPADRFRIQALDVPPCTGCTSPLCPDCEPGTHGGRN